MPIADYVPPGLRREVAGQPAYVWAGGAIIVAGGLFILQRRRKAKASATVSSTLVPADAANYPGYSANAAPLPGWGAISGALGSLGGSSPSGPLLGYTSMGEPVYGHPGGTLVPGSGQASPPQPEVMAAAPVIQAAPSAPSQPYSAPSQPVNQYSLGQVVNPGSGERIVSSVFSPVYGWINATNLGGIYTGGGGTSGIGALPYGGSYLGYVAQRYGVGTPSAAAELATHGSFPTGGLSLTDSGGYQLRNVLGETYAFG